MFELFDPTEDYEVKSGANLPHWFQPGVTYFVTFRLIDSIPNSVSKRWHDEKMSWLAKRGMASESEFKQKFHLIAEEYPERISPHFF